MITCNRTKVAIFLGITINICNFSVGFGDAKGMQVDSTQCNPYLKQFLAPDISYAHICKAWMMQLFLSGLVELTPL
jgi:hypothetical protein